MKTLKAIYGRYSGAIFKALAPLGLFGVFALAFVDSAALGMPLDAVVGAYVYSARGQLFRAAGYILLAAAGSAIGSSVMYFIGKKGGEALLQQHMAPARIERMRRRFEKREFITLLVASVLPPPAPFKLFLISAAAFQMAYSRYLLAILLGRIGRFTILAVLVIRYGPQVASAMGSLLRNHLGLAIGVFIAGGAGVTAWMLTRRSAQPASS